MPPDKGTERTIVGIMPPGFTFYQPFNGVWIPLPADETTPPDDPYRFSVVARLRTDVTPAAAEAATAALGETLDPLLGEPLGEVGRLRAARSFRLARLDEGRMIPGRIFIGAFLQAAAGFVMLVVCANLGGILFARGMTRQREIAVRRALGAPRSRLVRQIVLENMLLAVPGAAAGVVIAFWGQGIFRAAIPLLGGVDLRLDLRALAFAVSLATLAILLFGSKAALRLSTAEAGGGLKEWPTGATGSLRGRRWQNGLAIVQIAVSLILLVGASLAYRTIVALGNVDPGFDARGVFPFFLTANDSRLPDNYQEVAYRIAEELDASDAIAAVSWRGAAPPEAAGTVREQWGTGFVETRSSPSPLPVRGTTRRGPAVSTGFFRAFGLSLLRGRTFDDQDLPGTPLVVVLSERAADLLWRGEDPIGKQLRLPGATAWLTVVGIVSNMVSVDSNDAEPGQQAAPWPDIYLATSQFDNRPSNNVLWVRPTAASVSLSQLVHATVEAIAPEYGVSSIQSVWESEFERRQDVYRAVGQVLGALGLIAIVLSAMGTYSVISHAWTLRVREIGVRVALGATTGDVLRLVLRDCQKLGLVGVVAGAAVSLAIYRLAARFFFGISSWDPVSYAAVALLLLTVAGAAGLGPARRATRTDPIEVLRQE